MSCCCLCTYIEGGAGEGVWGGGGGGMGVWGSERHGAAVAWRGVARVVRREGKGWVGAAARARCSGGGAARCLLLQPLCGVEQHKLQRAQVDEEEPRHLGMRVQLLGGSGVVDGRELHPP